MAAQLRKSIKKLMRNKIFSIKRISDDIVFLDCINKFPNKP